MAMLNNQRVSLFSPHFLYGKELEGLGQHRHETLFPSPDSGCFPSAGLSQIMWIQSNGYRMMVTPSCSP
jgi:hypothetical protein